MIEYKSEAEGLTFLKAEEQYLLCIANCINTKLDKTKEPLTTALFTKFPEANIYKERQNPANAKGKPGSLIIKGRIAIILGTMYPGSKEYANDNREFRLKWFREGLIALQKISPRSIAVRENFSEEFGGDWHKYLFHLNEMDKSIKIAIYPYVIAIPIFNIVKFRQEDEHADDAFKKTPLEPSFRGIATKSKTVTLNGFGVLSLSKFEGTEDGDGEKDEQNMSEIPKKVLKLPVPKVLRKPTSNPILPIKIDLEEPSVPSAPSIPSAPSVPLEITVEVKEEQKRVEPEVEGKVEDKVEDKVEGKVEDKVEGKKKYIANPDWIDISTFGITGWDEIINDPMLVKFRQNVNTFFLQKELPKYGDFFKIYPPQHEIFNAFNLCPFSQVKVVIVGQDSYINDGEAMGLAFSVRKGVKVPPSLRNIYKELTTDIPGFKEPNHGSLVSWANQGVLLINSALTVREGVSGSHLEAWQPFTDQVITLISQNKKNLVFILWGNPAKKKQNVIKNIENHHIITAAHPSPLSASKGFFGCKCFSETNNYLATMNLGEIDWKIPSD